MLIPGWRSLAKHLTYGVIRIGLHGPFRESLDSVAKGNVMIYNATVQDVGEEGARPRREGSSNDVGGETTAMAGCYPKYKVCWRYEHASLILSVWGRKCDSRKRPSCRPAWIHHERQH